MSNVFNIFTDKGSFSWRKIMTAGALFVFMMATVGYLIVNDFSELPGSYQAIISGVFAFYFMKAIFDNGKITIGKPTIDPDGKK